MKRVLSLVLALLCCATAVFAMPVAGADKIDVASFSDLDADRYYYSGVEYCVTNGLMKGMDANLFGPEDTMTRAMFVTVLYRLSEETVSGDSQTPFTDLRENAYYLPAVAWAYENEIVSGMTETTFAPEKNVTREQMCTLIVRFASHMGYEMPGSDVAYDEGDSDELLNELLQFTLADLLNSFEAQFDSLVSGFIFFDDTDEISNFALEAVYSCAQAGIVNGMGNNLFAPEGSATRGQVATLLRRFVRYATTEADQKDDVTVEYSDKYGVYATKIDTLNDDGLVLNSEYKDDDGYSVKSEYSYDEDGNLLTCSTEDSDGLWERLTNTYDENGFLASAKIEDSNKAVKTVINENNDAGLLVTSSVKYEYDEIAFAEYKLTFAYDDQEELTSVECELNQVLLTCDADGKILSIKTDVEGEEVTIEIQYNEDGIPAEVHVITSEGTVIVAFSNDFANITLKLIAPDDSWCEYAFDVENETIEYTDSFGKTESVTAEAFEEIIINAESIQDFFLK